MYADNFNDLKNLAINLGIDLFGSCQIDFKEDRFHKDIRERAKKLNQAVSMGVALCPEVFETIVDGPTDIYKTHYRQANMILDTASFHVARRIQQKGYRALPIAASFTPDELMQKGHLSHKKIAELCGLGWRGRNNLLVTKEYGSAVRLTTILTNMPLPEGNPMKFSCDDCYECIEECPVKALGETPEDYNFDRCYKMIAGYARRNNFGLMICGHCIKVCKANGRF